MMSFFRQVERAMTIIYDHHIKPNNFFFYYVRLEIYLYEYIANQLVFLPVKLSASQIRRSRRRYHDHRRQQRSRIRRLWLWLADLPRA